MHIVVFFIRKFLEGSGTKFTQSMLKNLEEFDHYTVLNGKTPKTMLRACKQCWRFSLGSAFPHNYSD